VPVHKNERICFLVRGGMRGAARLGRVSIVSSIAQN